MAKTTGGVVPDKRAQVLEAAIRVFSERGYRGTSMWDLARPFNLSNRRSTTT